MQTLTAMFVPVAELAIVLLALVAIYLGYRVIQAIRVYFKFRGTLLVTCPETQEPAEVEVAARSMAMQAIVDEPCFALIKCSRWPMRRDCGQDCLRQIEARPSELRISAAWKVS